MKTTTYTVLRFVDGQWWPWGTWADRNKANEVALELRHTCEGIWVRENEG